MEDENVKSILNSLTENKDSEFLSSLEGVYDKNYIPKSIAYSFWKSIKEWKVNKKKKAKSVDKIYGKYLKKTGSSFVKISDHTMQNFYQLRNNNQMDNINLFEEIEDELECILLPNICEFRGENLLAKEHSKYLENCNGELVMKKAPIESLIAHLLIGG